MTDPTLTHLYFLLDRSGSMQSIRSDTEGGYDAFIAEQRHSEGTCLVTLAQFDDTYEVCYTDLPVEQVPPLQLMPRGMTALLDSIGRLVTEAGARLAALPEPERPATVVVGIMTDGLENASREWTHPAVKALVEQQSTGYGWQFLYLGADQDAIEVGASLGVRPERAMTYSRGNVREAMAATSANVAGYREQVASGRPVADAALDFTAEQRRRAQRAGDVSRGH